MEQDANFYSSLGSNYEDVFWENPGLLKFIERALPYLPLKANVLDVGCGFGKPVAMTLAAAGHSVTGIDISGIMIPLS
jgi:2-polyprenyl-3-methyl-5-hydroxy-6-metoxy-1,4-benzoquinol methylase